MTKMENNTLTIEQQDWMRFLTSDGLAEKAGCTASHFTKMIVKEFADNAVFNDCIFIGFLGYLIFT